METHFVENPFIKMREKALRKKVDSKTPIGAEDLEKDNFDEEDIILMKDENKLVIKDLEQEEADRRKAKLLKRQRMTSGVAIPGEDMDDDTSSEEEAEVAHLRKKVKDQRSGHKHVEPQLFEQTTVRKRDEKRAATKQKGGHVVKHSGDAYKSAKGKGDVLKAGQHEPYAYIKLNPGMLNRRAKKQAVETFAGVVSHGKKTDKRQKTQGGLLSGMAFKSAE